MIAPEADASRVRLAGPQDEEDLFSMCKELHNENAMRDPLGKRIAMEEEKVRRTLHRALHPVRDNQGLFAGHQYPAWIGIVGPPGAAEGAVYLALEAPWYSNYMMLVELFNFVRVQHRQSTNAKDLIAFSKELADNMGIKPLIMGVLSQDREAAKCRLYRRQLGDPVGSFFVYQGPGGI